MYDIAICDDIFEDADFLIKRIQHLKKYQDKIRFHTYQTGRELLSAVEEVNFSLIFLDVCMDELDGEQIAEEIRKQDDHVVLVFFTGYADPTPHSIVVQPFRFLKKSMSEDELDGNLLEILERMEAAAKTPVLEAKTGSRKLILRADEIVYIEKANKSVRVYITEAAAKRRKIEWNHQKRAEIKAPDRLKDVYERFRASGFGYPHDSYIVNLQYVTSLSQGELRMEGYEETAFNISRGKMMEFNRVKREFYGAKYGR
ncbi:MAG: LytTR family DNA-binding domain-containing protein [Lachnospiraceae bacterium]|nr:LytTR family DNA-binding domain-containing protein [Lachnospiraceae bacterium]